jgi:formate/nitrite transporter FocA (FNT family)
LVLTIQADVLKKQAIQANASAWIGLIVDNYAPYTTNNLVGGIRPMRVRG